MPLDQEYMRFYYSVVELFFFFFPLLAHCQHLKSQTELTALYDYLRRTF